MFDAHAHIGEYRHDALICTSQSDEYQIAERYPLHSYGTLSPDENVPFIIEERLREDPSAFIGEFGPDSRFEYSITVIKALLELARDYSRPFTLHVVRRHDEMLHLLRQIKTGVPFIVHGFTSSAQIADEYIRLGGFISLGKRSLRSRDFTSLLRKNFLLESDLPCSSEADRVLEEVYTSAALQLGTSIAVLEEMIDERRTVFTS